MKPLFESPKLSPTEARFARKIKRWRKLSKLDYRQVREMLSDDRWPRTHLEMQADLKEFLFLAGRALLLYHSLMRALLDDRRISERLREQLETVCGFDRLLMEMPDGLNTWRCAQRVAEIMTQVFKENEQTVDPAALGSEVRN